MPVPLPDSSREQVYAKIFRGRKIQAIVRYREATGADLQTAKDAVESMESDLRALHPDRLQRRPRRRRVPQDAAAGADWGRPSAARMIG